MAIIAEYHSLIEPTIPRIIDLLKDNDSNVPACVGLLVKFSQHGKTPNFSALTLLTTGIVQFRHSISPAVPVIGDLLKDTDWKIREAGAGALSGLFQQGNISVFLRWHC
jgi:hypothetical protein